MQKDKGVSIIVCCFNSKDRLPETLRHIALQKLPNDVDCEVIVVDNASTDGTGKVAARLWAEFDVTHIPLNIVDEVKPGLMNARQRGVDVSKYEYLVFCDDDNWLSDNYAINAFNTLNNNPGIAALGGINLGVFEQGAPPEWIEEFGSGYAIGKQGTGELSILKGGGYLVGAGICVKKSAYINVKKSGFKLLLSGRTGSSVIGGEDVELCYIFKIAGYEIAFSDKLVLQHYMPANRMTKKYLINMWRQYPAQWMIFDAYKIFLTDKYHDSGKKYKSAGYWQSTAAAKLRGNIAEFPKYLYHKIKGTLNYTLAYETDCLYQYYIIKNANKLVKIIDDIERQLNNK